MAAENTVIDYSLVTRFENVLHYAACDWGDRDSRDSGNVFYRLTSSQMPDISTISLPICTSSIPKIVM